MEQPLYEISRTIDELIWFAQQRLELDTQDVDYARNQILDILTLESYQYSKHTTQIGANIQGIHGEELVDKLLAQAVEAGLVAEQQWSGIVDRVMAILTPLPSKVRERFESIELHSSSMEAMEWFYDFCENNTSVTTSQLATNPRFNSHGLIITINRSKPEFTDMSKAAAGNSVSGGYPACTICHDNVGFAPRNKRTLRTVPVELGQERWFWQFSPYGYFAQHGICVNQRHTPMHVNRETFSHIMEFVERFPGYFLGCNAALPRIGGSVLAHDHYQGGGEILPMFSAGAWKTLRCERYPQSVLEIVDWPGTAVRVVSHSREEIIEVSDCIRKAWVTYDNSDLHIACEGEGGTQSALSPSVIHTERGYEMNLIFRNNAVSEEYPDGIFHAHPEFYAVKREPIGLIEAQGLFILPGRLVGQLQTIEDALVQGQELPEFDSSFAMLGHELINSLEGRRDKVSVRLAIREELGSVCYRILENTAVFKQKEQTEYFLSLIGFSQCV